MPKHSFAERLDDTPDPTTETTRPARDPTRLVRVLSETLENIDAEHRGRIAEAERTARDSTLRRHVVSMLTERHRERRAAYVEAIRKLGTAQPSGCPG